jgi:hypothetical protein
MKVAGTASDWPPGGFPDTLVRLVTVLYRAVERGDGAALLLGLGCPLRAFLVLWWW